MKIKVLNILGSARIGGIEKLVLELLECQQSNHRVRSDVLFVKSTGEFLNSFQALKCRCYSAGISGGYDLRINKYVKLFKIFKNYDVLHFHSFNYFVMITGVMSGKKIVYTEHGNFGFGRKRRLSDRVNDFLKKILLNNSTDFITFNSAFTRSIAIQRFGLSNVSARVVYNGIILHNSNSETGEMDEKINQKIRNKFIIGTTSRFAGFKRIDRLIDAFSTFRFKEDSVLLLVGDGILRAQLEARAAELGIQDNVCFTGFKIDINRYQRLMDVCVFPSENEPFGLVAIECLSLGKPVIVFKDGGGITEIIQPDFREDVVENISELTERMEFYFQNRSEINKYRNQRIALANKFNINTMQNKFFDIYSDLLQCAE